MKFLPVILFSFILSSCATSWSQTQTDTVETEKASGVKVKTIKTVQNNIGINWDGSAASTLVGLASGNAAVYQRSITVTSK